MEAAEAVVDLVAAVVQVVEEVALEVGKKVSVKWLSPNSRWGPFDAYNYKEMFFTTGNR